MTVYEWESGTFPAIRLHSLAFSCAHCENPACVAVCESGALYKEDEFGAVLVDQDKCTGCRKCYDACPMARRSSRPMSRRQDEQVHHVRRPPV